MSGVRVLVGTRKGAFIITSDGKRERWDVSGPHFAGWEIYHVKGSPADPNRLYASQSTGWFGQLIQRSNDGGKTWEPVGNKFVYDGVPGTHQWYDGTPHPWEFARVWHLEPSLNDPDTVYAGVEDAALFRSTDGGQNWQELNGLRGHGSGPHWAPGAGGLCLHTILIDPGNPDRIFIAISAAGAFRTDDGGKTWRPINRGLKSEGIPNPTAEVGHCVHRIAMHRSRPNVLFMQKHWDVMRSDDAGESWTEVSGNLPTDFGFPIDVHAHEPETIFVVPIKSDSEHFPPDGKLRVYRSRTGGNDWEALTKGLPQRDCYVNVLRDAMAVDAVPRAARCTPPPTREIPGPPSFAISRPFCPSKSRHSNDSSCTSGASPDARTGQRRGNSRCSGGGDAALCHCRAGNLVSHASGNNPRPRDRAAPAVREVLRLRAGPVSRTAGCAAAGGGCHGGRAVPRGRGDGRRLTQS
jgi:photosystem II stability/assembly factor-like uncharacterized protein